MVMLPENGHDPVILCMRVGSITRKYFNSYDQSDVFNAEKTGPSVQGTENKGHDWQPAVIEPRTFKQRRHGL